RRARVLRRSPGEIRSLGVLAKNDEVDRAPAIRRADPSIRRFQRTQVRVQQDAGPKIDIEIELEPEAEQDIPRVLVSWHARVADGAQENGVNVAPQVSKGGVGEGLARLEIMIRAVRQPLPGHGGAG